MFIYYVFHIGLITESYKQNFFEQAQIYFALKIVTNKIAKRGHMDKDWFFACKNLTWNGLTVKTGEIKIYIFK